jgi:hypothetical protein
VYRGKESIGVDDVYDQMLSQVKKQKRDKGRGGQAVRISWLDHLIREPTPYFYVFEWIQKRQKLNDDNEKGSEEADFERIRKRAMMTSGGDDDYSGDEGEAPVTFNDGDNVIGANSDGASGRRSRSSRPHMEPEEVKPQKSDPYFKEKQEFLARMTEKERKDKEIQDRLAAKKVQKEKRDTSKKNLLYKKTKSGQPLMKGMMAHLLGKIEESVQYGGK